MLAGTNHSSLVCVDLSSARSTSRKVGGFLSCGYAATVTSNNRSAQMGFNMRTSRTFEALYCDKFQEFCSLIACHGNHFSLHCDLNADRFAQLARYSFLLT